MSRDARLETLLTDAAREVDFPPTPDLAGWIRNRIDAGPMPVGTIHLPRTKPSWKPIFAVAAVVAVVLAFTLTFSVTARRAVADLLGIVGIEITWGESSDFPSDLPGPDLSGLDLGERVSRSEARRAVGFAVRGPQALDRRAELYLDRSIGSNGMVSTIFRTPGRPKKVDVLITEFEASIDEAYAKKVDVTGSSISYVRVGRSDGYWLSGEPHVFGYVDDTGQFREETLRLAGNALLWETDGITYRVEGARNLREAQQLARRLF